MRKRVIFALILDIAALYASLFLTLFIRYGMNWQSHIQYHLVPFSVVFIIWLVGFMASGLYESRKLRNDLAFWNFFIRGLVLNLILGVIFFYFITNFGIRPRTNLFLILGLFAVLAAIFRYLHNGAMKYLPKSKIVFWGEFSETEKKDLGELIKYINDNPNLGYEIVVDDFENKRLAWVIEDNNVSNVVVASKTIDSQDAFRELPRIIDLNVDLFDFADFYEKVMLKIPISSLSEKWFLENLAKRKPFYHFTKRLLDIFVSLILLIITVPTVFPISMILIPLMSRGPIFYKQKRVGKNGKIIEVVKFRTMVVDAEKMGVKWAEREDSRVFGFGKILRKLHLDEMPQYFQVLKGELSVIGPRPERPEFDKELEKLIPYYNVRYSVKPGMTGWAQLHFRYGASVEDAKEKLRYEIYYIKHRSFLLDLGTILRSLRVLIAQEY